MNTSTKDQIIVVGSINTDMVIGANKLPKPGETLIGHKFFMNPGGKGANQAVAAARMGGEVAMIANLGVDVFGDSAIAKLKEEGVNCEGITRDPDRPSGVAIINVDDTGENQIVVAPGANETLDTDLVSTALDRIPPSSIVLLQLEIPIESVVKAVEVCQRKGCRIMLDPAPAQALPESVYKGTYLLTPNRNEAELLSGILISDRDSVTCAAEKLLMSGVTNVAITLGSQGVFFANAEKKQFLEPTSVSAVDTTAAGDCFNGAVAAKLSQGCSLVEGIKSGILASSICVTRHGAQDAMPYSNEVNSV
jgi:ribokinase